MRIRNIGGLSQDRCKCNSWLQHWRIHSNSNVRICLIKECKEVAQKGIHIQKESEFDLKWYIIPICQSHSQMCWPLELKATAILVNANKRETCGD